MKEKILEQKGASLLETVVAVVLIGVFLGISVALVAKNSRWIALSSRQLLWNSDVNHGYRALQRDLMPMQSNEVVLFHPRMLILRKPENRWVIYYLWNHTLYRNWQPVIHNLQNGNIFKLLDAQQRPTISRRDARYLEVELTAAFTSDYQLRERFYVAQ